MKFSLSLLILFACSMLHAQSVSYKLTMPKPQNHYFHVEMELKDFKEKEIDISLPVWAPGSYLVREFSKNINMVKAFDEKGNPLEIKKQRKNSWTINTSKNNKVVVKYDVYAFELSVRTSFLDLTHGYVSGSGVFMFVEGHLDASGQLKIVPFEGFSTVSTALPEAKSKFEFSKNPDFLDFPENVETKGPPSNRSMGLEHIVAWL